MKVLDASALLAFLSDEPGAEAVQAALAEGGVTMHAVNWAEVLSARAERGDDPARVHQALSASGLVDQLLVIDLGTPEDAVNVAALRPGTRATGPSLGDRYGLALGLRLNAAVLTTDRTWSDLDVGVAVQQIR